MLAWQDSLFDQPCEHLSFDGIRRDQLSATSWVDLVPGWFPGHEELFGWLLQHADWHQRSRVMWEREVPEPRLTAFFDGALPPAVEELRQAVSGRYDVEFDSCLVNLYRDGNDAVAWHGDTVRKTMVNPLVVTISLGSARRFLVRRRGGGPVLKEYAPGHGDLMVMGGAMQHSFEHAVPRQPNASGARMSVTMRHSRDDPARSRVTAGRMRG